MRLTPAPMFIFVSCLNPIALKRSIVYPNGTETDSFPYNTLAFIFDHEGLPYKSAVTPNDTSPIPDAERFLGL